MSKKNDLQMYAAFNLKSEHSGLELYRYFEYDPGYFLFTQSERQTLCYAHRESEVIISVISLKQKR